MGASLEGRLEVARALLSAGAEISAKASNGLTALDMAAKKGHAELRAILAQAAQQSSSTRQF
jgi:ankyrin repeat protein